MRLTDLYDRKTFNKHVQLSTTRLAVQEPESEIADKRECAQRFPFGKAET
jgi:hypothetical protein